MDAKLSKIYYSPRGYWKGMAAIKQLAAAAKVSEDVARAWLTKQELWQVYLPGPRYIPRPKFDVSLPNAGTAQVAKDAASWPGARVHGCCDQSYG